jgi:phenylalanyl-tRNA synthetase alpha chain
MSLLEKSELVKKEFEADRDSALSAAKPEAVETLRVAYLGRKGKVTALMEELRNVSKEERPAAGKAVNIIRQGIESSIEELKSMARSWELAAIVNREPIDVTLPVGEQQQIGSIHPARDMQDTFYIDAPEKMLLRTHTSNIQIHTMLNERPPLRIIAPGRVFRRDNDMTHTPMFHQIEGFVVDEDITFADLKGTIDTFLKAIFGSTLKTRFRPSFFPFVEPGAEFDVECGVCKGKGCRTCKETGWIEIGGCGMIHPNVFESVGYDSSRYSGFAFGFGMDRIAMNRFALPDLRQLFEGDYEFLGNFPIHSN